MNAAAQLLSEGDINRLRWRCRRGMLENDLFIDRLFSRHSAALTQAQAAGLMALMDLPDNELLDLLLGRQEPTGDLNRSDVRDALRLLRQPH
jgi:antitoxin CptB